MTDDETPREKLGGYVGLFGAIIPGMIVSGFMPDWNVLPLVGWLAVAGVFGAIGGAIATPKTLVGMLAGGLMALGCVLGIDLYVRLRSSLIDGAFLKLELVIGALIGAIPGALIYTKWAKPDPEPQTAPTATSSGSHD